MYKLKTYTNTVDV